jgi:rhamnose transport system ATP-binding protein
VEIELRAGEVHALLGENGAGKSTLLKILGGAHRADAAQILVDGVPVEIHSPHAAQRLGIALIHQEPLIFRDLDVAENIFIGHRDRNRRNVYRDAQKLLDSLGVHLNPRAKLRGLSIADQQTVELASALSQNARIVLMDEPTAALTPAEVADLFRIVRQLKTAGVAIVFISHRLDEVFAVADRITVLRDGRFVATKTASQTNPQEVIRMMVGRELTTLYERKESRVISRGPALRVEHLSGDRFHDVSFELHPGEIVGLAGLVGAGRTEVSRAIFGVNRASGGAIYIDAKPARVRSPSDAIARGLAYVPEDRQHDGLVLPFSAARNVTLTDLCRVSSTGLIRLARERAIANDWRTRLRIRLQDIAQPVRELSGGNQQKVVLSKWLQTDPQASVPVVSDGALTRALN